MRRTACAESVSRPRSRPALRLPQRSGRRRVCGCAACRSVRNTSPGPGEHVPRMFLNGTAMRGGDMHHLVGDAEFLGATTTAARYRFHSVDDRYPALEDVGP